MDKTRDGPASATMEADQSKHAGVTVSGHHLSRRFEDRQVLRQLDLTISGGSSCVLSGPSGRGKSTLLSILGGFDRPDSGTVSWDDKLITAPLTRQQRRMVALLTQHPRLEAGLTLRENILLATAFHGQIDEPWLTTLLDRLELRDLAEQAAPTISGGQAIRTALVRCLLPKPRLLLADEPTASLDAVTAQQVTATLLDCSQNLGITVIIASHDPHLIASCDQHLELPPC